MEVGWKWRWRWDGGWDGGDGWCKLGWEGNALKCAKALTRPPSFARPLPDSLAVIFHAFFYSLSQAAFFRTKRRFLVTG